MKYQRLLLVSLALVCIAFQAQSQEDSMDPVARQIMASMDAPGSAGSDEAFQNMELSVSVRSAAGSWNLELDNGVNINLTLSQSGSMVFGSGTVVSDGVSQAAAASGSLSGNILRLSVVLADGTRLYALSLDLSGQTPAKTYSIFSADAATSSGTVRKVGYTLFE